MKRQLTILSLFALTLFSCGGNTNKTQNSGTEKEQKVIEMTEDFSPLDNIAQKITQQLLSQELSKEEMSQIEWKKNSLSKLSYAIYDDIAGKIDLVGTECFEKKDGGFFVLYVKSYVGEKDIKYSEYIYSGGKLTPTENVLPRPSVEEFYTNFDQFPPAVKKCLEKLNKKNPSYQKGWNDPNELDVCFDYHGDYTEYPKPLFKYEEYGSEVSPFPHLEYKWDGEKFTLSPDSKKYTEDLKFFQDKKCLDVFEDKSDDPDLLYFGEHDVFTVKADLDHDGNDDIVIAEKTEGVKGAQIAVYYFKNGKYTRKHLNKCDGIYCFTDVSVTDKGVLRIAVCEDENLRECLTNTSYVYMFRFQDDYLHLIGGKEDYFMDYGDGEEHVSTYNMLTNKVTRSVNGNGKKSSKTYDIPAYPLIDFYWFKFGDSFALYDGCDMTKVWEQVEKMPFDENAEPFFLPNYLEYEIGMEHHRLRRIQSFPRCVGEGEEFYYYVYDLYHRLTIYDDQITAAGYHIREYIFKNGKLTETDLQPELAKYAHGTDAYFSGDTLFVEDKEKDREITFVWETLDNKFKEVK